MQVTENHLWETIGRQSVSIDMLNRRVAELEAENMALRRKALAAELAAKHDDGHADEARAMTNGEVP